MNGRSATVSVGGQRPAELETARKVLELERRQGHQDRAVTTGLASFLVNWERRMAATGDVDLQALAEQVVVALDGYAALPVGERAARLDAALGLLGEESGTRPSPPQPPSPASGRGGSRRPTSDRSDRGRCAVRRRE